MIVEIKIVQNGVEQDCQLSYNIRNKQCPGCTKTEAKQYWRALVQLRQKPHHKRSFLYLEQLILKHKAHRSTSNIKERKDGIDFYYLNIQDAARMVDFLSSYCGTRVINSTKLISEDRSNNTANKKFTFSVEILPFCKDDLVYLGVGNVLGLGPFALVSKVRSTVIFIDPITQKIGKLYAKQYYANQDKFKILMRSGDFKRYRVIYCRRTSGDVFEATITADEFTFIDITTRLKIKDDDVVAGYNLGDSNLVTDIDPTVQILLVRVIETPKRNWKLKSEKEIDDEYRFFIEDIANDREMLNNVCVLGGENELIENIETLGL